MSYCAPCERDFADENSLQQHMNSSYRHKLHRQYPVAPPSSARPNSTFERSGPSKAIRIINPRTGAAIKIPELHCSDCNKQFSSLQALKQHQKSPDHPKHTCIHCGIRYPSQELLGDHVKKYHSIPCTKCEEHVSDLAALAIHDSTIHPSKFPCGSCGQIFPSLPPLLQHEKALHPKYGFPCHKCNPSCGRIFDTIGALERHSRFMVEKYRLYAARNSKNTWSILSETPASVAKLRDMTHNKETLVKNLYVMELPSDESVNKQRKCKNCREKLFKLQFQPEPICRYHPVRGKKLWNEATNKLETYFSCCGQKERCVALDQHMFEDFEALAQRLVFEETPKPSPYQPKRKAVALDCEMGTSITNSCELIQLSAVDYFTGEVLIDSIVRPNVQMAHYNTPYSGITPQMMRRAIAEGEFLKSFEGARAELWKWIDSETILIGHSLNHDLNQLHLVHPLIIDSYICVPKLVSSGNSLKLLTNQLLGKDVQGGLGDKRGHDCVEDALAARELVIWCSRNQAALDARAIQAKVEEEARRKELEILRKEKEALQIKKAEERLERLVVLDTDELESLKEDSRDLKVGPLVTFV